MGVTFEWDPEKAKQNLKKRGVSADVFPDSDSVNEALRFLAKIIRNREKQMVA